jgi:hypothetical protein
MSQKLPTPGKLVLGQNIWIIGLPKDRGLLITVWFEVRVLPGPPCSPMRTGGSRSLTNSAQFAGIPAGSNAGRGVSAAGRGRDSANFGVRSLGSANPFLAPGPPGGELQ